MSTFTTHLFVSDGGVVGHVKFVQDAECLDAALFIIAAWSLVNRFQILVEPVVTTARAMRVDLRHFAADMARARSDVEAALRVGAERR